MSEREETTKVPTDPEHVVEQVRERYGRIASGAVSSCCGGCCEDSSPAQTDVASRIGYDPGELAAVPEGANLGLGCGAPVAHLKLQPGETVLDLGSGAGFDAFLAAPQVGPQGRVIGVDMTREMIDKARENTRRAGLTQVEFRHGRLESLPVDDASVDAVTSNCVINLVPEKRHVFREVARVLRPGGRVVISDILLDGELPVAVRENLLAYVGCVAGALQRETYFAAVREAGLSGIEVLKDVDFIGTVGDKLPQEVLELMADARLEAEELRGKVRSVTFRAVKP